MVVDGVGIHSPQPTKEANDALLAVLILSSGCSTHICKVEVPRLKKLTVGDSTLLDRAYAIEEAFRDSGQEKQGEAFRGKPRRNEVYGVSLEHDEKKVVSWYRMSDMYIDVQKMRERKITVNSTNVSVKSLSGAGPGLFFQLR